MEFDKIKDEIPFTSPVAPQQLSESAEFQFDCHPGIACFNACCKNIDITLTPYDIVRLCAHFEMDSRDFVARYSLPFELDHHGMPGLKLATKPGSSECVFLGEEGCTVYANRPVSCRYYALGSMAVKPKDGAKVEEHFFVVKEPHCLGHNESKSQTVGEYRHAQGADIYDDMNREWRDIIIKKRSSGPTVGKPSERSIQLFDMCSYDMDSFLAFVRSDNFKTMFDLDSDYLDSLESDREELLRLSLRFLKQVLFGEMTIALREGAAETRLEARRPILKERQERAADEYRRSQIDNQNDDSV